MRQPNIITTKSRRTIKNLKFSYDDLNDLLYAYKENSSVHSNVVVGDFHLEFSKKGELVGIEILNASDILKEYDIPKKILKNIEKITIKVISSGNSLLVFLNIFAMKQEKSATITMNNMEMPFMQEMALA